jgi:protein-ribulosamine 3-kinase
MAPKLDPAIVKALSLDIAVTNIASHGGSGFSSTAKLTSQVNGAERVYFVKTRTGKDAETMFAGEYSLLIAVHEIRIKFFNYAALQELF